MMKSMERSVRASLFGVELVSSLVGLTPVVANEAMSEGTIVRIDAEAG